MQKNKINWRLRGIGSMHIQFKLKKNSSWLQNFQDKCTPIKCSLMPTRCDILHAQPTQLAINLGTLCGPCSKTGGPRFPVTQKKNVIY